MNDCIKLDGCEPSFGIDWVRPAGQHYHHSHRLADSRARLGLRGFFDADACSITGGDRLINMRCAPGWQAHDFAPIDAPAEIPAGGAYAHEWIASPLGLTSHRDVAGGVAA